MPHDQEGLTISFNDKQRRGSFEAHYSRLWWTYKLRTSLVEHKMRKASTSASNPKILGKKHTPPSVTCATPHRLDFRLSEPLSTRICKPHLEKNASLGCSGWCFRAAEPRYGKPDEDQHHSITSIPKPYSCPHVTREGFYFLLIGSWDNNSPIASSRFPWILPWLLDCYYASLLVRKPHRNSFPR